MTPIIQVENVSKKFILHHEAKRGGYVSLRDVVAARVKGLLAPRAIQRTHEEFWALKDLNFEVNKGDRLGIIGRNGAGKSTLLKILSRITEPTTGSIRIQGRVASLLEVGTGFHPELTGRENIFLNGAILGMSRQEVRSKFDEIVAFAEVEKFLDTPVKRYSSGMYVRLAFAVAAHLEPEILVVDEVLAVGDAQFQKKCLGKMEDVSTKEGRTVLFVSHNIAAIRTLTNKGLFLHRGEVQFYGDTTDAISKYSSSMDLLRGGKSPDYLRRGVHASILGVQVLDEFDMESASYEIGKSLKVLVEFTTDGCESMSLELFLFDSINQTKIGIMSLYQFQNTSLPTQSGTYKMVISIPPLPLASGSYRLDAATSFINVGWDHYVEGAIGFDVLFSNPTGTSWDFKGSYGYGNLALVCEDISIDRLQ